MPTTCLERYLEATPQLCRYILCITWHLTKAPSAFRSISIIVSCRTFWKGPSWSTRRKHGTARPSTSGACDHAYNPAPSLTCFENHHTNLSLQCFRVVLLQALPSLSLLPLSSPNCYNMQFVCASNRGTIVCLVMPILLLLSLLLLLLLLVFAVVGADQKQFPRPRKRSQREQKSVPKACRKPKRTGFEPFPPSPPSLALPPFAHRPPPVLPPIVPPTAHCPLPPNRYIDVNTACKETCAFSTAPSGEGCSATGPSRWRYCTKRSASWGPAASPRDRPRYPLRRKSGASTAW